MTATERAIYQRCVAYEVLGRKPRHDELRRTLSRRISELAARDPDVDAAALWQRARAEVAAERARL